MAANNNNPVVEKDPLIDLPFLLDGRYGMKKAITKWMGNSRIYQGFHSVSGKEVAIKVHKDFNDDELGREFRTVRRIGLHDGICRVRWQGEVRSNFFMVMDLHGPSLHSELCSRRAINQSFTNSETGSYGTQILNALRWIHEHDFIHCDVKPANTVTAMNDIRKVYVIDFGLAEKFRVNNIHKPLTNKPFKGTSLFASTNVHARLQQSRRDDLESLGYSLLLMRSGSLPWLTRGLPVDVIGQQKTAATPVQLCMNAPSQLLHFMTMVKQMGFTDEPQYDILQNLLQTM